MHDVAVYGTVVPVLRMSCYDILASLLHVMLKVIDLAGLADEAQLRRLEPRTNTNKSFETPQSSLRRSFRISAYAASTSRLDACDIHISVAL